MGCKFQSIESKVEITSLHIHKIKEKTFMHSSLKAMGRMK